jgi:hypothetical protein
VSFYKAFIGALLIGGLAACGGGGNNAANTAASAAGNAMASGANAMASGGNAMTGAAKSMENRAQWMNKSPAPIPAGLSCGAVQPVWVNTMTHKYHEPASPAYGKTKEGKYMCPSAAKAEGDTPAGKRHHQSSN